MYKLDVKGMEMKDFTKKDCHFKTPYVEENRTDYELTTDNGIRIYIGQFCGPCPYMITVYSPNGKHGGAAGFYTPDEALQYLKKLDALNQNLNISLI